MSLSLVDKIEMTEVLWDSIYAEAQQLPVTNEQSELLRSRLEAFQKDAKAGFGWDEVVARIKRK